MIFLAIAGLFLAPIVLAWVIGRPRPHWRIWKVVLASAAPFPLAISLFCAAYFAFLSTQPPACTQCDNPGMAMFGLLMIGTAGSLVLFTVGAVLSWITIGTLRS